MNTACFSVILPMISHCEYKNDMVEYSLEDFGSGIFYVVSYEEFTRVKRLHGFKYSASLIEDLTYYITVDVLTRHSIDSFDEIYDNVIIKYEE